MKVSLTKKYADSIAYPTIFISISAIMVYIIATYLGVSGFWSLNITMAINTLMAYILFTTMHEAGHLNISGPNKSARWIDETLGWISGLSLFAPFYVFKVIHFKHHAHTNDPENDPDHWLASKSFIGLIFHSFTIFPVYLITALKYIFFTKKMPAAVKREVIIGMIVFAFLFAALLLMLFTLPWQIPIKVWILPAFIAQAFLAFAFDWLPHHPHQERKSYLNTRVLDVPALSLFLLSQNYHLMHHLHPRIPFYNYRKAYQDSSDKIKEKKVQVIKWTS